MVNIVGLCGLTTSIPMVTIRNISCSAYCPVCALTYGIFFVSGFVIKKEFVFCEVKIKVNQSRYGLGGAQNVPGS